jgi:hypothetical protein
MHFKYFVHDIVRNLIKDDNINIKFSWDIDTDESYIVYQLEQLTVSEKLSEQYIKLLTKANKIYDYSSVNLNYYPKNLLYKVEFLPFLPSLTSKYHNNKCDTDVLFYGCLSPRRIEILKSLDLETKIYDDLSLDNMQTEINNSRYVLSYGTYSNVHNDSFRVSLALNLGANILYEQSQESWYNDFILSNFKDRIKVI